MKDIFILIADDEPAERLLAIQALSETGLFSRIEVVNNGKELLDCLHTAEVLPRIILADINMPLVSGFDALSQVKTDPRLFDICFIIFSTACNQAEMDTARVLGADRYIVKPVDYDGYVKLAYNLAEWFNTGGTSAS